MKEKAHNKTSAGRVVLGGLVIFIVLVLLVFLLSSFLFKPLHYESGVAAEDKSSLVIEKPKKEEVLHLDTPKPLKAIYMTSCVVSTPSFREKLVKLVEETEVNSLVIDIKDFTGTLSYKPENEKLRPLWDNARCGTADMKDFIKSLHEKDIYVIGRVTVFQDPYLTKIRPDLAVKTASTKETWKDHKGISFTDPGAKEVWDYHIEIAKDAYAVGFDEINFDYIRFPSDGPMNDIYFSFSNGKSKQKVIESFFRYLKEQLDPVGVVTSADIFGMTATNFDDLNIGQVLERALPYFDYVAPMVYPSHYPSGFNNWPDPNKVPYEIIKFSMDSAVKRAVATSSVIDVFGSQPIASTTPQFYTKERHDPKKLRTWIQDFDYPVHYTPEMVRTQIKATYDAGLDSWMIWDPANTYTRSALLPATNYNEGVGE